VTRGPGGYCPAFFLRQYWQARGCDPRPARFDTLAGFFYNGASTSAGVRMGSDKVKMSIELPRELRQAAQEKADAEDVAISQVIRWWLRAWLDGELPTRPPGKEADK